MSGLHLFGLSVSSPALLARCPGGSLQLLKIFFQLSLGFYSDRLSLALGLMDLCLPRFVEGGACLLVVHWHRPFFLDLSSYLPIYLRISRRSLVVPDPICWPFVSFTLLLRIYLSI